MRLEDQTKEAFQEDFGVIPQTSEPKGKGYIELLVDNIIGLDNEYESFGEAFGKSFNEDELGTLKNMALSAYEGAKEFVTSPIETTKDVATEISDSVSRLGAESLDGRIKRMYGVGYQEATEEQVTKAREAVIGDAITASSLVPAAKGVTTVAKAAIPGKVQADVVGQMRSLIDGDKEFRTESTKPAQGLSAQAVANSNKNPFVLPKENLTENLLDFYSPIKNSVESLDFGDKGLTGSVILKHLREKTPNTNVAELDSYKLELEPNTRYTREDIKALLPQEDYTIKEIFPIYRNSQRQNLQDVASGYFEFILQGEKETPFYHFTNKDLAHARGSFIAGPDKKRLLVEELQSDILQNVGKPKATYNPAKAFFGDVGQEFEPLNNFGVDTDKLESIVEDRLKGSIDNETAITEIYRVFGERPQSLKGAFSGHLTRLTSKKLQEFGYPEEEVDEKLWSGIDLSFQENITNFATQAKKSAFTKKDFPVTSTTDVTKKLLLGLIAKAQKEGATEIVMPPLSRIAAMRAGDFTGKATGVGQDFMDSAVAAAEKALKPTYVDSFDKATELLNREFSSSSSEGSPIRVYEDKMEFRGSEFSKKGSETVKVLDITKFPPLANYKLRFAEGGMVEEDQMNRLMQEGGIADDGMTREPVTGNEIPPGSMASEVRDDIPAQLSEGEYIVPADVVRFFGVRFFEDLRSQAKQGLQEMDADGRIGGTPVDAQGVPVGGQDEELTPEEEQMLMEVLGSSGAATGMAYGGMAQNLQQPMSNPYQDQSALYQPPRAIATAAPAPVGMAEGGSLMGQTFTGFESRRYYNPETKQEMTINFLDGRPLGVIPTGFVPWSAELVAAEVKPVEPEVPEGMGAQDGDRGRDEGDAGADGDGSAGYRGWAEKNAEAINSDPLGFGMSALEGKQGFMSNRQMAGLAGMVNPALGIGVMGASAISGVQNIAEARAAVEVAKAKGLNTDALEARINEAVEALPGAVRSLTRNGVIGSGSGYTEALSGAGAAASARTGTGIATGTPASKGQDKGVSVGYGVGQVDPGLNKAVAAAADKDKDKPSGGTPGGGFGTGGPGNVGQSGSTGGTPGGGFGTGGPGNVGGNRSGGSAGASERSGGAFAPGGLVSKKTTPKKPRKGLAS